MAIQDDLKRILADIPTADGGTNPDGLYIRRREASDLIKRIRAAARGVDSSQSAMGFLGDAIRALTGAAANAAQAFMEAQDPAEERLRRAQQDNLHEARRQLTWAIGTFTPKGKAVVTKAETKAVMKAVKRHVIKKVSTDNFRFNLMWIKDRLDGDFWPTQSMAIPYKIRNSIAIQILTELKYVEQQQAKLSLSPRAKQQIADNLVMARELITTALHFAVVQQPDDKGIQWLGVKPQQREDFMKAAAAITRALTWTK